MSQLNFGIRIGAENQTAAGLRSSLASIQSFARTAIKPITIPFRLASAGLGVLRDINLGLRPALAAMESVIDRGSRLDTALSGMRAQFRVSGAAGETLAEGLQAASQHTLSFVRAVELLNRSQAQGTGLKDVFDAVAFAARKAQTIGEDAAGTIDAVLSDLGKGRSRALDDLGIATSMERVAKAFDELRGPGAFEALEPLAQNAEFARQAVTEMRRQMAALGTSGGELSTAWTQIKTTVGDTIDRLANVIVTSQAMRSAMESTSDLIRGISEHFQAGGSFGELLWGKGQSGGLLGVIGGAFSDMFAKAGEWAGHAFSEAVDAGKWAIDFLAGLRQSAINHLAEALQQPTDFAAKLWENKGLLWRLFNAPMLNQIDTLFGGQSSSTMPSTSQPAASGTGASPVIGAGLWPYIIAANAFMSTAGAPSMASQAWTAFRQEFPARNAATQQASAARMIDMLAPAAPPARTPMPFEATLRRGLRLEWGSRAEARRIDRERDAELRGLSYGAVRRGVLRDLPEILGSYRRLGYVVSPADSARMRDSLLAERLRALAGHGPGGAIDISPPRRGIMDLSGEELATFFSQQTPALAGPPVSARGGGDAAALIATMKELIGKISTVLQALAGADAALADTSA
ncbi:MAG: hypothetical protein U1A27_00065 [Phycisphaerae bacterium]